MKTKIIMNSGGIRNNLKLKKKFHQEMIKGLNKDEINILICSFAQAREYWEEKFPGYAKSIEEDIPATKLKFSLAMPSEFANQIERSDIIYFNGGDDHLFAYWMNQFDFSLFLGKILSTNSGSSDYLSDSFWPNDWKFPMKGSGIIPIKFIPHYGADSKVDWLLAKEELALYGNKDLPIYVLKEGEFVVFETEDGHEFKETR